MMVLFYSKLGTQNLKNGVNSVFNQYADLKLNLTKKNLALGRR